LNEGFGCAGCGESQPADAEIQALVDSVKSFVESSKGVAYTKFEAVSFRSQVVLTFVIGWL
jgi:hypothetical protein